MKKLHKISTKPTDLTTPYDLERKLIQLARSNIADLGRLPTEKEEDADTFLALNHIIFSVLFKAYIPIVRNKCSFRHFADNLILNLDSYFVSDFWKFSPQFCVLEQNLIHPPRQFTDSFGVIPTRSGLRKLIVLFGHPDFEILDSEEYNRAICYHNGGLDAFGL